MLPDQNVFIGRQPILNTKNEIVAYELLYRSGTENYADVVNDISATAQVLINTMINIGVKSLLGGKLGFINTNETILMADILEPLNKKLFVLEILEDTVVDAPLMNKVNTMFEEGYTFALDDFIFSEKTIKYFNWVFDKLTYVKVDLSQNTPETIKNKLGIFRHYPNIKLLAEKVETIEDFNFYKRLGFEYFQGYYFAKPTIITGRSLDPEKLAVMEMVSLIEKNEDIEILEKAFRQYPEMTINLLKFINSAAIFTRSKITSVRQAIALLGQKKLMQWLILMLYAGSSTSVKNSNPLFQVASQRAKIMENIVQQVTGKKDRSIMDEAFLVGLLSKLDVLFQIPLEQILGDLNMAPEIQSAILERKGILGNLLTLVEKAELNRTMEINLLLKDLHLSLAEFTNASIDGYVWAGSME